MTQKKPKNNNEELLKQLNEKEQKIKKLEEEKLQKIKQQRKDLKGSLGYGMFLAVDVGIIGTAIYFMNTIKNYLIPFNALHIGIIAIPTIAFIYANKKINDKYMKTWKRLKLPKKEEKIAEEEIKRLKLIKKLWLKWRIYDIKCKLDEYKESNDKAQKIIGKIKGKENKQLEKIKEEIIESILLWKEDFVIKRLDETGKLTNEPVDEEYLRELSLNDLYEYYFLPGVLDLESFINGNSENEIQLI